MKQRILYIALLWFIVFLGLHVALKQKPFQFHTPSLNLNAPLIGLILLEQEEIDQLIKNSDFTILTFWETWCEPCHEEMPVLQTYFENFEEARVEIVGIFNSSSLTEVEDFINQYQIFFPHHQDQIKKWHETFDIQGFPTTVVLNNKAEKVYESRGFKIRPGQDHAVDRIKNFILEQIKENP